MAKSGVPSGPISIGGFKYTFVRPFDSSADFKGKSEEGTWISYMKHFSDSFFLDLILIELSKIDPIVANCSADY